MDTSAKKEETPITRILIVVAMTHEAISMITALKLNTHQNVLPPPLDVYYGKFESGEVFLIINGRRHVNNLDGTPRMLDGVPVVVEGVSPVPTAISVWEGIRVLKPQIIINAGTAGGVKAKGAIKGKVYIIGTPFRYHDRLINFRLPGDNFEPNNYQAFGIGSYAPFTPFKLVKELGLPLGSISTGASFDTFQGNVAEQFDKNGAFLKDMESATVAEVASWHGVDVITLKGVTDYIDHVDDGTHHEQFEKELKPISEVVAAEVSKVVHWILGKKRSDL